MVDAALGILLRCEIFPGGPHAEVEEFIELTVDAQADPEMLAPPAGSIFGDGPVPVIDDLLASMLGETGLTVAKTAGGLAAGGLGALIRYTPTRPRDTFEQARAEDPDAAMPAEALPGWARFATGAAAGAPPPDLAGPTVGDALLHLLYRNQEEPVPFTAAVHEWADLTLRLAAAPPQAPRAGFDGVGFLLDSLRQKADTVADPVTHKAWTLRFGRWDRHRLDVLTPQPGARVNGAFHARLRPVTIVCDGSRSRLVYANRVEVWDVRGLDDGLDDLVDGSWLLGCRLSGGEEVMAGGRPGYLVIATARPGAAPLRLGDWVDGSWLPAAAVVDAATGRLLRLREANSHDIDSEAAGTVAAGTVAAGGVAAHGVHLHP